MVVTAVVPFFQNDVHAAERLGAWIRRLSGGKPLFEKLLLCAKGSVDFPVAAFQGLSHELATLRIPDGVSGWPQGCNYQFFQTAKAIDAGQFGIEAFYYLEPDNVPLRKEWWHRICGEYQSCGKPFWGIEQPNVEDGKVNGMHMIGTGIYPRDAWSRIKVYAEMEKNNSPRPWDCEHRHEVNPQCHFTKLAIHCAGMSNYTPDGFAVYPKHFQGTARYALDIPNEAQILHGCKDSSLQEFWAIKAKIPKL